MVISSYLNASQQTNFIRPLRIKDDLMDVANLIELCFSGFLDEDGLNFIQNMKEAAYRLRVNPNESILKYNIPKNGFICREKDRIVGCLNTIPIRVSGQSSTLIANVAVHPDYRRRGIGRELTQKALQSAQDAGLRTAWLQVRLENQPAIDLYQQLGFVNRAIRTTWHAKAGHSTNNFELPRRMSITSRHLSDWEQQKHWLNRVYPEYLRWHLPFKMDRMNPGVISTIKRYFNEVQVQHYVLRMNEQIMAAVSWQSSSSMADHLWLSTPLDDSDLAIKYLLPYLLKTRRRNRTLSANFPTNFGKAAFEEAGFKEHVNLIWMERKF